MSFVDDIRNVIGFRFKPDPQQEQEEKNKLSAVEKQFDDGSQPVGPGGYQGHIDIDRETNDINQLITRYRDLSLQPEFEKAIEDIVNEAVVTDDKTYPVKLVLDNVPNLSDKLREKISKEFEEILQLLNFGTEGHEVFKRWYIDGRLFYFKIIDRTDPKKGLVEVRYVDPRKIAKIREDITEKTGNTHPLALINRTYEEYFIYNPGGLMMTGDTHAVQGVKIPLDTVTYVPSGLVDKSGTQVLSYLHKAIRPYNQLKMAEDAMLVYRLARSSEKRAFYIGTGKMSRMNAERYVNELMNKFRTRISYNMTDGDIRSERRFMSVLDDYWIPVPEGVQETRIETLQSGGNLGETGDVEYYQEKLYEALGIPVSRLKNDTPFVLGRSGEILRDEMKFAKFISKLRRKFCELFDDLLKTQLMLKNILSQKEYETLQRYMYFDFLQDNAFEELKHLEIMNSRLDLLDRVEVYSKKYFSQKWIRNNILYQTDDEIERLDKEIDMERLSGKQDLPTGDGMGMPGMGGAGMGAGPSFADLGLGPEGDPMMDDPTQEPNNINIGQEPPQQPPQGQGNVNQ